jgi:hypothetical protein
MYGAWSVVSISLLSARRGAAGAFATLDWNVPTLSKLVAELVMQRLGGLIPQEVWGLGHGGACAAQT